MNERSKSSVPRYHTYDCDNCHINRTLDRCSKCRASLCTECQDKGLRCPCHRPGWEVRNDQQIFVTPIVVSHALNDQTYEEASRHRIAREISLPSQATLDRLGATTVGAEREQRPAMAPLPEAGDGGSSAGGTIRTMAATEVLAFSDQDPTTETASSWNSSRQRELEALERESRQLHYEEQERLAEEAEEFCSPCEDAGMMGGEISAIRNFMVLKNTETS